MKSRRINISEDPKTILGRSPNSINGGEPIPIDVTVEILSRLPAKSIVRCRCVSKHWNSTLDLSYFTKLFLTRSCARPKLFFTLKTNDELLFFSAPQENLSSVVTASFHMKFPFNSCTEHSCGPVHGLVCFKSQRISKWMKESVPVICNPSTRDSVELPKVKTRIVGVKSFFGYDPTEKQYKILSMSCPDRYRGDMIYEEHQVMTLGTQRSWRKIQCSIPHASAGKSICINGCLYYQAEADRIYSRVHKTVCFDVRYEKFSFINKATGMMEMTRNSTLVNYKGKLGAVLPHGFHSFSGCLELWVLVDAEKHEWSKHVYALPPLWKSVVGYTTFYAVGITTASNEIVFYPGCQTRHFYVVCHNFEKETIRRVEIQGMDTF